MQLKKEISDYIHREYGFVNCVGIIDGTLFPLELKPQLNSEDYYTRKGGYATHSLIVCDHLARIRWIKLGWPGSVHDNRVWMNCELQTNQSAFFNHKEYILGDSAFKVSDVMIPAFKKPFGANLNPTTRVFQH